MAKVTVANGLERDGKTYKGGDEIDLPASEVRELLALGKVRPLDKQAEAVKPKPEIKEAKNG